MCRCDRIAVLPGACPRRAELPAHSCRLAVIRVVSQADSPHGGLACKLRANGQPTDTVPRSPSTISLSKCLIILIQCCEISGDESLLVLDDFTNLGGIYANHKVGCCTRADIVVTVSLRPEPGGFVLAGAASWRGRRPTWSVAPNTQQTQTANFKHAL